MSNEPTKRLPEASAFDTSAAQTHVDAKTMLAAFDRITAAAREYPKPSAGLHAELTNIAEAAVRARSKIDEARRLNEEADALFADILGRTERLLAAMAPAETPAAAAQPFTVEPLSPEAEERAFLDALGVDHVADELPIEEAEIEARAVSAHSEAVVDEVAQVRAVEPERVPTVSHVVNQLGRADNTDEQPEATAGDSNTTRTTVAMLEAMVEQLAAAMPAEPRPPLDARPDEMPAQSAAPESAELRVVEEPKLPDAQETELPPVEDAELQITEEPENQIAEASEPEIAEAVALEVPAEPVAEIATDERAGDEVGAVEITEVTATPEIAAAEIEAPPADDIAGLAQPESIDTSKAELPVEPDPVAEALVEVTDEATALRPQEPLAPPVPEITAEPEADITPSSKLETPDQSEPEMLIAAEPQIVEEPAETPLQADAAADVVADPAEPDLTELDFAEPETAEPNATVLDLAEAELAETDLAETDLAEADSLETEAVKADVAISEPPETDAQEPASEPAAIRPPVMPEIELLNSFARMETMAFLPPDIGTAVIFQKPKATEVAVDEPVDLPAIEAVAVASEPAAETSIEMDVIAIEPHRAELHLPKAPMLEHAAIEPVTAKPVEDEPILVMPPPDPSEAEIEQAAAAADPRDEATHSDSAFDDTELDSLLFGPSPDAPSKPETTLIEAPPRPARTFEAPVFRQISAALPVQPPAAPVAAAIVPAAVVAWGTDIPIPASALARTAQSEPEPEPAVTAPASVPAPAPPAPPQRAVPASVAYDALAPLRAMSDEERIALFE